ncbi:hypothetical protein COW36_12300 [bacterium (Candidatus Blackallbacteria) CG17_big_fil_post_rev_8_21_14_2_50_48_46]|uniref:Flagellar Assembly Protein A N-terminal region domain-containing protein n=1 Tax=bacterium (Candidatus Blackallbacteria) CG17_big_fil_post_rev_8_21_14_2_50_48_46 TaxID=2014261 RepID=A0A2M7G448_9BACT|nr:MAG: hypothetical protein COW64_02960 [bacterium (Candidatus Blackallbacteria) CG18_big_fil_WC_8_21_14_2_50_49_26]PIW16541.1 MAG: hypothetical protein COW36_12300 [bacterium (Candidatus Blackallbacteria) CG17_big_fil_post_rev_8_21_14_2_50_48_46]PIW46049.1 MAG: hypothetical protein COW20_17565 [bacterium (Candidatus Blackallbacteria) CG13_big_fil_rev_8_21_14_2_50_49_14]
MSQALRIQTSEDKTQIYAILNPLALETGILDPELLLEALLETDYSSFQFEMDQKVFDELTQKSWAHHDNEIIRCLARRIEFNMQTRVSEDKMSAWVSIQAAYEGEKIQRERLIERLSYTHILKGYLEDAIAYILEHTQAENLLIARGKLPVHGQAAWLEPLWQETPSNLPVLGQTVHSVDIHTTLGRLNPATAGTEGYLVTGQKLSAHPGQNLTLLSSQGSKHSESNPQVLVSTRQGCPVLRFNTIRVDPILTLEKVDRQTGNIDYDGCVLVLGNIEKDYTVKTKGHLEVLGNLNGARLEIAGDLHVHGDITECCAVWVKGQLQARSLQNSFIECQRDLKIREAIRHSHVRCGRNAQAAQVEGGHLIVLKAAHIGILGSHKNTKTFLHMGLDQWFMNRYEGLVQELKETRIELEDTLKLMIQSRTRPLKTLTHDTLKIRRNQQEFSLEQLRDELSFVGQNWLLYPEGEKLEIQTEIFAGIEINMGTYRQSITQNISGPVCLKVSELNARKLILQEALYKEIPLNSAQALTP